MPAVKVELDFSKVIMGGRPFVPIRAIAEVFGREVGWNENTRTVSIK